MRRRWLLFGSIAMLVILCAAGTLAWRKHTIVSRVDAILPARPSLAGQPEILGQLLAEAEQKATMSRSAIEGVAELGRLYHANDFVAEAQACWQFLRREQPNEARWRYYLADLHHKQSDHAAMASRLEETLAIAPDYAPARLQLANLQFKSGELDQAERNFRRRLETLPEDPYARLGLARLALQRNRREEAKGALEELLEDSPHFSSGHNLYAELLANSGDEAGAHRHRWLGRETLRYREPADPWLEELQERCYDYNRLNVLGTIELQTEQHDRARLFFERAVRIDPGRPDAYEMLGRLYLKRGDAASARDLLEQALPQLGARKSSGVFTTLSMAYRQLDQPEEAARVAQLGLEQLGRQSDLLDSLGLALAAAGRHEEAVQAWEAALAKSPGDAGLNHNLARSLLALRRLDDALAALDRSLTLQPTYLPTLLLRGEIELQANHLDVAEKYLRPAFDSHPEDAQARRLLAQWHLRRGAAAEGKRDSAAAEQHYRDGLALDGKHPELLVRLGLLHLLTNRPAEAVGPLLSFHQLQPESPPGCLFLGQAYAATNQREKAREILTRGAQLAERSGNTRIADECRTLLGRL